VTVNVIDAVAGPEPPAAMFTASAVYLTGDVDAVDADGVCARAAMAIDAHAARETTSKVRRDVEGCERMGDSFG
jgi:hypothetical protein